MIGIGIIGYGYWGPNLVRNFMETPGCQVTAVAEPRAAQLARMSARYPGIQAFGTAEELIASPAVDFVIIATPVATHFALAMAALKAGKHVLVEKPMTATSLEALALVEEAERRGLMLAVDHTFLFTGAVRKIRQLVQDGALGDIYYYDSVRVNLGLFQRDVNVIWDLAVHDLAILDYVLRQTPVSVSAHASGHVAGEPEDIAYLTINFASNLIGHLHVNWLAPVKVRRTLIGGSQKMVVYDDLEPSEKVKVYDKGITVNGANANGNGNGEKYRLLVGYRAGDMWAPQLDMAEALGVEAKHLIGCIERGEAPLCDGQAGLRVVRILEAASESLRAGGQLIELGSLPCLA
ncbi:MAG TPA: Gfo/Idh/MocA family oxidoreductase [Vicinamibacterales bacterium]|nr:Gfo/Idh/MocA family oxidoreductase [Vicinamibacterales bacterium]